MNHKIDVLYIASHGFAVRMVIQTDMLGQLVNEGLRVGIVSSDINDVTLKEYCDSRNVLLYEFKPKVDFYSFNYINIRKYALEEIRKNPAMWEKHLRNVQHDASLKRRIKYHIFYCIYLLFSLLPFLRKLFLIYDQKSLKSEEASAFIEKIDPHLVVSTYPVNVMEAMLLKASKQEAGRKRIIHMLSWDNITCKGKLSQLAQHYIVWGNIMKAELIKYYRVKQDQITVTGVPHFDCHHHYSNQDEIRKLILSVGFDPEIPYLFFGMSSPYFAPAEIEIVEQIAEWVRNKKFGAIQFVVRPHPQNMQGDMADFSWLPKLQALKSKLIYVDYPRLNDSAISWSMEMSDMKQLSLLIGGAAIVLNSGSTISIDALVHNKPVILTSFDGHHKFPWFKSVRRVAEYEHVDKIINLGGAVKVENYFDLEKAINRFLKESNWNEAARQKTIYEECYIQDGNATKRVVEAMKRLI